MFVRLPFELSQNDFKLVSHLCHLFKTILLRIYSSQGCARIQGYCFRATNLGLLNNARNKRLLNNAFFDVITVRYPSTEDPHLQPCHPKRGCAPLQSNISPRQSITFPHTNEWQKTHEVNKGNKA